MDLPSNKTILSGLQPSGSLHIGNYLGAIKQWIALQENNDAYYCIVDLHAITVPYEPKQLQSSILDVLSTYIAAGLDPNKCTLFVQSHVSAHTELAWLLGTTTPLGELFRTSEFKGKAKKVIEENRLALAQAMNETLEKLGIKDSDKKIEFLEKEEKEKGRVTKLLREIDASLGLLAYPVLQAADILLYQTNIVPVGEDQRQHLEFTNYLAQRFNGRFGQTFTVPEALINPTTARIMSLTDPAKKMSKSDNIKNYIALTDKEEIIRTKIMGAVTETEPVFSFANSGPAVTNLLKIYQAFSEQSPSDIEQRFKKSGYQEFKEALADIIIEKLTPIRERYQEIRSDEAALQDILKKGAKQATTVANQTLANVKQKMGLL